MSQLLNKIQEYMIDTTGKVDLNEKEFEQYKRVEFAFQMLMHYKTKRNAVGPIMKTLKLTTRQQGYNLIKQAEFLFGQYEQTSKQIRREQATEMAIRLYNICLKKQDYAEANKSLKNFNDANALKNDDPDLPDFSKLQMPEQPVVIDLEFLNQFKSVIDPKVFEQIKEVFEKSKIFQYIDKNAIDIDFEDVTNE